MVNLELFNKLKNISCNNCKTTASILYTNDRPWYKFCECKNLCINEKTFAISYEFEFYKNNNFIYDDKYDKNYYKLYFSKEDIFYLFDDRSIFQFKISPDQYIKYMNSDCFNKHITNYYNLL